MERIVYEFQITDVSSQSSVIHHCENWAVYHILIWMNETVCILMQKWVSVCRDRTSEISINECKGKKN